MPLLTRATPLIGHFQIRNRGTIGGSVAHADPAAEYPAVALALDAELEAVSPRGRRTIPAAGFFSGLWTTELAEDEILTGVRFPVWEGRCGHAVEELARRHGDFAIAGAVVSVQLDGDDRVQRCAIGLLGPRLDAGAGFRGGSRRSPASTLGDVDRRRGRGGGDVDARFRPVRPPRVGHVPPPVGAVMVARAWTASDRGGQPCLTP